MAIASASPCPEVVKSTSFKQYTINIPNTDRGKAEPRYTTKLGSFEFFEKNNKRKKSTYHCTCSTKSYDYALL